MSKIGRRPIRLGDVKVEVSGSEIKYKGSKASGSHVLPSELKAEINNDALVLAPAGAGDASINRIWGLHRALIANKIEGASKGFERQLQIIGLGFKASVQGNKMQLFLGFSHKIDYEIPAGVVVETDKTGQLLTLKSFDKMMLGRACSYLRDLKPPEPYKGIGIRYVDEVVIRKAGKAKTATAA